MNPMVYNQIDHNSMGSDASTFLHSCCIGGGESDRVNNFSQ